MRTTIAFSLVFCCIILMNSCKQTGSEGTVPSSAVIDAPEPRIFAEGVISTGDYETHPAFSPTGDTLYFLKCSPDANFFTICVSYKKDSQWTPPRVASFSGKYLDADPFVTRDGDTIYFISNRPVNDGDSVKKDWDIWKTGRNATGWGKPVRLDNTINSSENEYFPVIAANGNLYFGSSKEGGKGRADIYIARYENGKYAMPENLGDSINTADNEYEPFVAPDESYLIFMATRPDDIAHAEFCISYNVNGKWSKAQKLPAPVNSPATEWGGKASPDGKYFFFGSNRSRLFDALPGAEDIQGLEKRIRSAGNGLGDIYYVNLSAIVKAGKQDQ